MAMELHVSTQQIAEWLARQPGDEAQTAPIAAHLSACKACRGKVARAEALLDLAAAAVGEAHLPKRECPDALELAAFLDGTLKPSDAARITAHLSGCDGCQEVVQLVSHEQVGAPSAVSVPRRIRFPRVARWTGLAGLAMAAVIAGVLLFPRSALRHVAVTTYGLDAVRSADDAPAPVPLEFDVQIRVASPGWVHLLTLDAAGQLDFLHAAYVEREARWGRYGVRPAGKADDAPPRIAVIVLHAARPLADDLAAAQPPSPGQLGSPPDESLAQAYGEWFEAHLPCRARAQTLSSDRR